MTKALDRLFTPLARNLIKQFGGTARLVRAAAGSYDPATSTGTSAATTETTVSVVIQQATNRNAHGMQVRSGDILVLISAASLAGIVPVVNDRIRHGSALYTIADLRPQYASDDIVMWVCLCRN